MTRLAICLAFVAKWEGGWSDHAADKGGKTKFGITETTWDAYAYRHGIVASVRDITIEQAHQVYEEGYWAPSHACDCAPGLDLAVLDFAIHSGVHRAVTYLQVLLGVTSDGVWGPRTAAALARADQHQVALALCTARIGFLELIVRHDPTQVVYRTGWLNRVADLRRQIVL